jgi:superfamily I DNA/RNA helicase/mRNA-degrading endonuclease RelE of RelBE toxin-antitoxin system
MDYALVEAEPFIDDLDDLEASVRNQVSRKLGFIEHNPWHPSLDTCKVESMEGIHRSKVNDYYRLYWFFHPEHRGELVLWRIGPREWTDHLKNLPAPDLGRVHPIAADVPEESDHRTARGFFSDVHPNHLILLGVPVELVNEVKALDDIEKIYDIGLPRYAEQVLADLYTAGYWGTERLVGTDLIFYRANADELDSYCRGKTTRLLLNLHPDQREYAFADTNGPLLVKGTAGSGKTTIGLYRALHLAKQQTLFAERPDILFVTYNETLATAIDQLFCELRGEDIREQITVTTLRDWAMDFVRIGEIAKDQQLSNCLSEGISAARKAFPDLDSMHRQGNKFFAAEIADVIKGRGVSTLKEYKELDRYGRDTGLRRRSQRPFVWRVYEVYQDEMDRQGLYDYEDPIMLALDELASCGEGALYDAVIVDEAQDLRPIEIELVARLAGGRNSPRLTLLADPQQSIYYKGISWREAGVEIVGRTKTLTKNFRNTREILAAAWSLAEHGTGADDDAISSEAASRRGPRPRVTVTTDFVSQVRVAEQIILDLCQKGQYNPGDFAVLAHRREDVNNIRVSLANASIPVMHYRDEDFDIREYRAKAITMHSAKGLEWPVVIVVGLEAGKLPREHPDTMEQEELLSEVIQDRKLLYVAMTRAMELLYLIGSVPCSSFLNEISRECVIGDSSLEELN